MKDKIFRVVKRKNNLVVSFGWRYSLIKLGVYMMLNSLLEHKRHIYPSQMESQVAKICHMCSKALLFLSFWSLF